MRHYKKGGSGSNCIPLINKTIEAFTNNNFYFEGKIFYGASQLKTPDSCIVKREGEIFLIFKRKSTQPLSASEISPYQDNSNPTASLFSNSSILFFSNIKVNSNQEEITNPPSKRRLRLYIGSKKELVNNENTRLENRINTELASSHSGPAY